MKRYYHKCEQNPLIINITSIAGYMGCRIAPFILRLRGRTNYRGSSHGVKSFGIHITNVAPGDFATNIASGRYHTCS
jgi:NAD(P)-dependent dehydrogenase (short-subunit alcohol dehydrogenase family)